MPQECFDHLMKLINIKFLLQSKHSAVGLHFNFPTPKNLESNSTL